MAFGDPGLGAWDKAWSPMAGKQWMAPGGKMAGWGSKGFPTGGWPGTGGCKPLFGPVGKVCNRATPFSKAVPTTVTGLLPMTTVSPLPSGVMPRTSYGKPVPTGYSKGYPTWMGKGGAYGKGYPTWMGKGGAGAYDMGGPPFGWYGMDGDMGF